MHVQDRPTLLSTDETSEVKKARSKHVLISVLVLAYTLTLQNRGSV